MGRIFEQFRVGKEQWYTLFDSGAKQNFVSSRAARSGHVAPVLGKVRVNIGGKAHRVRQTCSIEGKIRGKYFLLQALVLPEIGADSTGRDIDVIFGADTMQGYGVVLVPESEKVDLSNYHSTFVEF